MFQLVTKYYTGFMYILSSIQSGGLNSIGRLAFPSKHTELLVLVAIPNYTTTLWTSASGRFACVQILLFYAALRLEFWISSFMMDPIL